jgi:hypothetical protein
LTDLAASSPEPAIAAWSPAIADAVRVPPVVTPVNATVSGRYAPDRPISNVTVGLPVVTDLRNEPTTCPPVRATDPAEPSVRTSAPVESVPVVSASVPDTVVGPPRLTPAALLTVRWL